MSQILDQYFDLNNLALSSAQELLFTALNSLESLHFGQLKLFINQLKLSYKEIVPLEVKMILLLPQPLFLSHVALL